MWVIVKWTKYFEDVYLEMDAEKAKRFASRQDAIEWGKSKVCSLWDWRVVELKGRG